MVLALQVSPPTQRRRTFRSRTNKYMEHNKTNTHIGAQRRGVFQMNKKKTSEVAVDAAWIRAVSRLINVPVQSGRTVAVTVPYFSG